jgi:hypothetical protein
MICSIREVLGCTTKVTVMDADRYCGRELSSLDIRFLLAGIKHAFRDAIETKPVSGGGGGRDRRW